MRVWVIVMMCAVGCGGAASTSGAPYVPENDGVVLETTTRAAQDPRSLRLAALTTAQRANPNDVDAATALAQALIEASRRLGDPRLLGRAQGVLAPWWTLPNAPPSVLVLRATIRQSRHEFETALVDLDRLLELAPLDVQAHLTRAVVRSVLARYPEALADCAALTGHADPLVVTVCTAGVQGIVGQARAALASLQPFIARPSELQAWALSVHGEVASYLGNDAQAEASWKAALALDRSDDYSRAALADLYLDAGRFAEAHALVADRLESDALLLRVVLAEKGGHLPKLTEHATLLRERYAASRARGDNLHGREHARFALVDGDVPLALELASANWRVQHEPWDARILLQAALAAHQPAAAAPALAWLKQTGFEGPRHRELATKLVAP